MKQLHYKLLMGLVVLVFSSISCQFPGYGEKNQEPTQKAEEIVGSVATQFVGDGNSFSVTLTESQLNALIGQGMGSQAEAIFTNPKVDLKPGEIVISGEVKQSIVTFKVRIVVKPYVDENGLPKMELVEADLGPLPVPEGMNQQMSEIFAPMLLNAVSEYGQKVKLQTITVNEDSLTITGMRQ